jgi:hypothetical protein
MSDNEQFNLACRKFEIPSNECDNFLNFSDMFNESKDYLSINYTDTYAKYNTCKDKNILTNHDCVIHHKIKKVCNDLSMKEEECNEFKAYLNTKETTKERTEEEIKKEAENFNNQFIRRGKKFYAENKNVVQGMGVAAGVGAAYMAYNWLKNKRSSQNKRSSRSSRSSRINRNSRINRSSRNKQISRK